MGTPNCLFIAALFVGASSSNLLAQAPVVSQATAGSLPLPPNYRTTFENSDFLVMHVHYGAHEFVPLHDHSAYPTLYVYLNDSGEVDIRHEGPEGEVTTRPSTHTGAFRLAPGVAERHSVQSRSDKDSDFLRVELKTLPANEPKSVVRGPAPAVPAPGTHTEFADQAIRIDRIICPASAPCKLPRDPNRSLLIPVTPGGETLYLPANVAPQALGPKSQALRLTLLYP